MPKLSLAVITLVPLIFVAPNASAGIVVQKSFTPQVLDANFTISDLKTETGYKTIVNFKVKIKLLNDPVSGFQFTIGPRFFSEGLEAPDSTCQQTLFVDSAPDYALAKSTGLSAPLEKTKFENFTVATYEFANTFEKNFARDSNNLESVNACTGVYKINGYRVIASNNHGSLVRRLYKGSQVENILVVPFWDSAPEIPQCAAVTNRTYNYGNIVSGQVYEQCFHELDIDKIQYAYDNASSRTAADKAAADKRIITCVKGKLVKKISGTNPKCPTGYKVKK